MRQCFGRIYSFSTSKGRNSSKPAGLGIDVLFLEYTFVYRQIKDYLKPLKNKQ
jgi:hypothetical protein